MVSAKNELTIPPVAMRDPNSLEVLRVWIAEGDQHVTVMTAAWEDPAAWGILLSDLIQHIANGYELNVGVDGKEVRERILAMMYAELNNPTARMIGELVHDEKGELLDFRADKGDD